MFIPEGTAGQHDEFDCLPSFVFYGTPVLYCPSEEIRELIIDRVERHKQIPAAPTNNWRLLPLER